MALVQKYAAIAMLLILVVFNSLFTNNFFSAGTINNIITQCCPTILCAMGMTLVISTGGIDIGVGSVMALAAVMTAKYMPAMGVVPALIVAVLASLIIGCINGFLIGKLKLQAMVITLGMQLTIRGLAQVVCDGRDIYFNKLGATGEELALWGLCQDRRLHSRADHSHPHCCDRSLGHCQEDRSGPPDPVRR